MFLDNNSTDLKTPCQPLLIEISDEPHKKEHGMNNIVRITTELQRPFSVLNGNQTTLMRLLFNIRYIHSYLIVPNNHIMLMGYRMQHQH